MMNVEKEELDIYEVEALHQGILDEFKNDSIVIDMKKVNKIDMSVIQLFISTQKSCQQYSKQFELKNVSNEISDILKNCACDFLIGESK